MKFLNSALVTLVGLAFADAQTASRGRDAQSAPRGRVLPADGGYGGKKAGYDTDGAYGGKKGGYDADGEYGGKKGGYDADGEYGGKKGGYEADGEYGGKKAGYEFDGYGGKKAGYEFDGYGGKKGGYEDCGKAGKKAGYDFDGYGGKKAGYDFDGYGGKKGGYEGGKGKGGCRTPTVDPECLEAKVICKDGEPAVEINYYYVDDCNTPDEDPHGCTPMPSDFVGLYPCEEKDDGFTNEPATWVYTCYDRNCRRDDVDTAIPSGSFIMEDETLPAFSTQGRHMTLEQITETQPGCYIPALNRLDGFSPPPYYNICLGNEIELTPSVCS